MDKVKEILKLYGSLMDELQQRSLLLEDLAQNKIKLPPHPAFELAQIQVRKICEVLSLACLAAHDEIPEVKQKLLQKEYSAQKILNRLTKLHSNFFPVPFVSERVGDKPLHFTDKKEAYLSKEELLNAYTDSGNYLHRGSIRQLLNKNVPSVDFAKIQEWNLKLRSLLYPVHFIFLQGSGKIILCSMAAEMDGKKGIQCALAEPN